MDLSLGPDDLNKTRKPAVQLEKNRVILMMGRGLSLCTKAAMASRLSLSELLFPTQLNEYLVELSLCIKWIRALYSTRRLLFCSYYRRISFQ